MKIRTPNSIKSTENGKNDWGSAQPLIDSYVSYHEDPFVHLMLETQRGNQKAFASLYDAFKGPAMAYIYSMTKDVGTSEEIVQEAFLKIYRFRESYQVKAKFQTWLWTIVRNTTLDWLRKHGMEQSSHVESLEESQDLFDQLPDPSSLEEEIVVRAEKVRIDRCLQQLPPRQRDALVLKIVSDLSYEEVSVEMKTTVSTIKSLIFRARSSLTACLGSAPMEDA